MIPDPVLYNQNEGQIANDLLPVKRRLPKFLAWFISILSPVQRNHDLIFNDYANGVSYPLWVSGGPYNFGDRVIYIDNSVYELQNTAGSTSVTTPNLDPDWIKVQDIFIGVRERARYNSQKLLLEYALNRYFMVTPFSTIEWSITWSAGTPTTHAAPSYSQFYISNTQNTLSNFWLSNGGSGALTSCMTNGLGQRYFMGGAYSAYSPYTFTIYVPTAVYAAIEANQVPGSGITGEDVIRDFADKYVQAGKLYNVIQY